MDIMHDINLNICKVDHIAKITAEENPLDSYCRVRKNHGIQLRLAGNSEFLFGDSKICSEKGDVIYLPKGLEYTVSNRSGGKCLSLNFDTEAEYDLNVILIKPRYPERFQQLLSEGRQIRGIPSPSVSSDKLAIAYSVVSLFQKTLETEYIPKNKLSQIKPAMDFLENNDDLQKVNIEILAEICKISSTYFRQLFYKLYGMNPQKYIENIRIERAKQVIGSGSQIKSAAEIAGYNDTSYFCKVFKRHIGMTPKEYANSTIS